MKKRLIFVVTYNAGEKIDEVLRRLSSAYIANSFDVLIIDDQSIDNTFEVIKNYEERHGLPFNLKIMVNPLNQGYGGNQKLGYRYAIDNNYDSVVLLHGDAQYPPEYISKLLYPIEQEGADVVLGSRMLKPRDALRGGMPVYKYIGNRILTWAQNYLLKSSLSEFHTGFRAYSTKFLKKVPFQLNTHDFHFDTEILIQAIKSKATLREIAIPTHYGNEVCHVNGLRYAFDVLLTTLRSRIHDLSILHERKFALTNIGHSDYALKLGYSSSHTLALKEVNAAEKVLDIGCNDGSFAAEMIKIGCLVDGIDTYKSPDLSIQSQNFKESNLDCSDSLPQLEGYDKIICLDLIEHLSSPERFIDELREKSGPTSPLVILTTGNIAFIINRLQLLLGNFNYGERGILDKTHKRLFTFKTFVELLAQSGFEIIAVKGIPAPFPKAFGLNQFSKLLVKINEYLIMFSRGLFAYQIMVRCRPMPVLPVLISISEKNALDREQQFCEIPKVV